MATAGSRIIGPTTIASTNNSTLYTSTAVTTDVKSIIISNTTALDAWISMAINGTAATAANCFVYQHVIPAAGVWTWDGFLWMASGDTFQAQMQTASALQITASGITQ